MKILTLEDLKGKKKDEIVAHIVENYAVGKNLVNPYQFLIAYESVGSWGCDSSSFFLLKKGGRFYEVHGYHCSCDGFEGQWKPEPTTKEYLKSDKFYVSLGGYDNSPSENKVAIESYIKSL